MRGLCARDRGCIQRTVNEHREVSHLAARDGMPFAVDVENDRGIAEQVGDAGQAVAGPAPRTFIITALLKSRGGESGRSQIARTCCSYCEHGVTSIV